MRLDFGQIWPAYGQECVECKYLGFIVICSNIDYANFRKPRKSALNHYSPNKKNFKLSNTKRNVLAHLQLIVHQKQYTCYKTLLCLVWRPNLTQETILFLLWGVAEKQPATIFKKKKN